MRRRPFVFSIVRFLLGAGAAGLACGACGAGAPGVLAAIRPGTFAWDFRNRPVVAPLEGFERVLLSPRAFDQAAFDTLLAQGTHVLVWTQPVWASWDGRPVTAFPYDRDLLALAERKNATLTDTLGRRMTLLGPGPHASYLLDFRVEGVAEALAEIVTRHFPRAHGVVLDYGCGTLDWNTPGLPASEWARWKRGWFAYVAALKSRRPDWQIITQCDRWPVPAPPSTTALAADGIFLEHAGWTLNPADKVWETLKRGTPRANLLRQEDAVPQRRRLFAAIALLTGAAFNQCEVATNALGQAYPAHFRNVEHFELDLGSPLGAWKARSKAVYERRFERGFVLANLGPTPFRESRAEAGGKRAITIAAGDGLVAQTRDAQGQAIAWRTNEGR
ncbi:MAG: hypothetical protein ACREOU_11070 [Candidatus Eiseniibacteriota bacterium]